MDDEDLLDDDDSIDEDDNMVLEYQSGELMSSYCYI